MTTNPTLVWFFDSLRPDGRSYWFYLFVWSIAPWIVLIAIYFMANAVSVNMGNAATNFLLLILYLPAIYMIFARMRLNGRADRIRSWFLDSLRPDGGAFWGYLIFWAVAPLAIAGAVGFVFNPGNDFVSLLLVLLHLPLVYMLGARVWANGTVLGLAICWAVATPFAYTAFIFFLIALTDGTSELAYFYALLAVLYGLPLLWALMHTAKQRRRVPQTPRSRAAEPTGFTDGLSPSGGAVGQNKSFGKARSKN